MNKLFIKIISLFLIAALNASGILGVGEALAFFNDAEINENNTFELGILDFSLNSNSDFSPNLIKNSQLTSTRTINLSKDGTLDFKYKIKVENPVGDLCSHLNLKDNFSASGYQSLVSFVSDETTFSDMQSLIFASNSSSYDEYLQGEVCNFDIVFEGWQTNLTDNTQGFTDKETINSTVKMGYWDSPVVLNEFLPNAGNYDEFIEFYNKGASQVDMDGYYVMAGSNHSDVNSINTNTYSSGSTIIDPNGWLVVTTGGDMLDDASGTLTLYNSNGVEMDSYTYNGADHNVNNNPGSTNDLVIYLPFDEDLEDKSGNDNDGTNHGTTFATGKINQAASFDGVDYIEIPDDDSLDITNEITLEAWVYPESWDNAHENNILTKGGDDDWGVWNLHHTNKGFRLELAGQQLFESTPSSGLNTWYHIVGTYDTSTMKLYINGMLSHSKSVTGAIETNNEPLRIGKQFWYGNVYSYWDGLIDEVKIYNRALSADEVLEHYNDVGSLGTVPVDKSYARIPDGSANWVDPIPTPGGPNKSEMNQELTIENQEQENINTEEQTATTVVNPVALDVYINTPISTLVDVFLRGEPEGVKFVVTGGVSHGELSDLQGMKITYIPDKDYSGKDQFTFQAYNEQTHSENAWVYITIGEQSQKEESTKEVGTTTQETVETMVYEPTTNESVSETGNTGVTNNTETTKALEENISASTPKATSTDIELATTTENIESMGSSTEKEMATTTKETKINVPSTATSSATGVEIESTTSIAFSTETQTTATSTEDQNVKDVLEGDAQELREAVVEEELEEILDESIEEQAKIEEQDGNINDSEESENGDGEKEQEQKNEQEQTTNTEETQEK